MDYGNPRHFAGRRAFNLYQDLCVGKADKESAYWTDGELSSH
jgi:cytochrome b pre-mRNA-processing protein 3